MNLTTFDIIKKEDDTVKWCYIGSNNKLPDEYRFKINDREDRTSARADYALSGKYKLAAS